MRATRRRGRVAVAATVGTFVLATAGSGVLSSSAGASDVDAHEPGVVVASVPTTVSSQGATAIGSHAAGSPLTVNVGLRMRDEAALDALLAAQSDPRSPDYRRYLTNAQFRARFAPTSADLAAVLGWLRSRGLRALSVSPDRLLVTARASTDDIERAFDVQIEDFRLGTRQFWSNIQPARVPGGLPVRAVSGLDDVAVLRTMGHPVALNVPAAGYKPRNLRKAYGLTGSASGEKIGLILWGAPLVQSDLNAFAKKTGSTRLVIGKAGADGIDFKAIGSPSADTCPWAETALDAEYAHGIAPGAHLRFWLAESEGCGLVTQAALESAVNAAANDATVHVVSNSWGGYGAHKYPNMESSLKHAAAVGTTFVFASGDDGHRMAYPAASPYVLAVGGTSLHTYPSGGYKSESAWSGSSNGCSHLLKRPGWQVGLNGAATCSGRAVPDVAADAAPATGAYVYFSDAGRRIGGTSLSTPLWAGMLAVWNRRDVAKDLGRVGFVPPLIYELANDPTAHARDFHDIRTGKAGDHAARAGWDEATGWGSPNFAKLQLETP